MKGYNIAMPKFPNMPNFDAKNGLSSLSFYKDGLKLYFDSLDRQLTRLSNDLSIMSKSIGVNLDKKMSKEKENQSLYDLYEMFNIL